MPGPRTRCQGRHRVAWRSYVLLGVGFGLELADPIDHALDAAPKLVVERHQAITFLQRALGLESRLPVGSDEALHALFELFEFGFEHVRTLDSGPGEV